MKNPYFPGSPEVNFLIEFLIGAVKHQPIPVLAPIVFAALWSLWCVFTHGVALLMKGIKGVLVMLIGSSLLAAVPLFLGIGMIAGGKMARATEVLAIGLIIIAIVIYYAIIPFLLVITKKEYQALHRNDT